MKNTESQSELRFQVRIQLVTILFACWQSQVGQKNYSKSEADSRTQAQFINKKKKEK